MRICLLWRYVNSLSRHRRRLIRTTLTLLALFLKYDLVVTLPLLVLTRNWLIQWLRLLFAILIWVTGILASLVVFLYHGVVSADQVLALFHKSVTHLGPPIAAIFIFINLQGVLFCGDLCASDEVASVSCGVGWLGLAVIGFTETGIAHTIIRFVRWRRSILRQLIYGIEWLRLRVHWLCVDGASSIFQTHIHLVDSDDRQVLQIVRLEVKCVRTERRDGYSKSTVHLGTERPVVHIDAIEVSKLWELLLVWTSLTVSGPRETTIVRPVIGIDSIKSEIRMPLNTADVVNV